MPTNEKSECLCHCHVHKDCGGSPDYICECACKLAEAKKEIEEWERNKGLACSHTKIPYEYTEKLLAATALISYERGREEQKKKDALIVAKVQVGICSRGARSGESFVLDQVRKTILNPSPDTK